MTTKTHFMLILALFACAGTLHLINNARANKPEKVLL